MSNLNLIDENFMHWIKIKLLTNIFIRLIIGFMRTKYIEYHNTTTILLSKAKWIRLQTCSELTLAAYIALGMK